MARISIREWLDSHEVNIEEELGTENVMEACYSAMYDVLKRDTIPMYVDDNKTEIASDLLSELPPLNPSLFLEALEYVVKVQGDWRELITDNQGEYDTFYNLTEDYFIRWLKEHNKKVFDDPVDTKDYYLDEGIDDFLEFAYEMLGGKDMFDYEKTGIFSIDGEDGEYIAMLKDQYEDNLTEYLEDIMDDLLKEEWFIGWIGDISGVMDNYITPDDYYPLSSSAWEFPTLYDADELNKVAPSGLIFFELNGVVYMALGTVGMSLSPAINYAFVMYSNLSVDYEEIAQDIISHGVGYYKYVLGEERLIELAEAIGYNLHELDRISKERYEQFTKMLDNLKEKVKQGEMTKMEAGLIGALELLRKPDTSPAKS